MEKLKFPKNVKEYMCRLYRYNVGVNTIQKKLKEHFNFEVSRATIYTRLRDWDIEKGKKLDNIGEAKSE
jgi:hypothetical protein